MKLEDARIIIEALAEGVDPFTGEELPEGSPYHRPEVIRALFAAAKQLRCPRPQPQAASDCPARIGSSWTKEEEQQLVREFETEMPLKVIATKHQRTRGAITSRLVRLGKLAPIHNAGSSIDGRKNDDATRKWWKEEGRTQAGKAWTAEEDEALLQDFEAGMNLEQIAVRRRRGVRAVEVRLVKLGKL